MPNILAVQFNVWAVNVAAMKNPSSEQTADEIQTKIYSKLSNLEKWQEVQKLRALAWQIKFAAVKAQYPQWREEQINSEVKKIFLYATT